MATGIRAIAHATDWPLLISEFYNGWQPKMSYRFINPVDQFLDANGTPLNGYYLHFLTTGLLTAKTTYADQAMAIPNVNPVPLTSAGRPSLEIWLDGTYRVILSSSATIAGIAGGTTIWDRDPVSTVPDYAASGGAALLGYIQAGTGAVARTVQERLRTTKYAKDFGATGDGATVDTPAILALIAAASKSITFEEGTYYLGVLASNAALFDLTSKGAGFRIETIGRVVFKAASGVAETPVFLVNNDDFHCGPVEFEDNLTDADGVPRCIIGFDVTPTVSRSGIHFETVRTKKCLAGVIVRGGSSTIRARDITAQAIVSEDTFYPFNCQNQGDNVEIGLISGLRCVREYFVYGVVNHRVNISVRDPRVSSGHVNISRSVGGLDTKGIDVRLVGRDLTTKAVDNVYVLINHVDLLGGTISNIKIDLDIDNPGSTDNFYPVRFVNYTGSGGAETAAASSNVVNEVDIRGVVGPRTIVVDTNATYLNTTGRLILSGNLPVDAETLTAFNTPALTWTSASSPQPALGNGTVSAVVRVSDGLAHLSAKYVFGSTTTFGTGEWLFVAPVVATKNAVGTVFMLDSGTAYFVGVARIIAGTTDVSVYPNNAAAGISSTIPFAWASGDTLEFSILYPVQ